MNINIAMLALLLVAPLALIARVSLTAKGSSGSEDTTAPSMSAHHTHFFGLR
ncbi:MAG: hypothetical protein GX542_04725 [Rhodococcus sp.]|nr:hypothetical protein [Rhodococcus sp. (in: high G+C Gram-positive bacteria)]